MRRSLLLAVGLAFISATVLAAPAQAQDSKHLLRFGGGLYATTGDANDISDNGLGAWVNYERRLSERYGLEFMAAYVDYDSILDILGGISLTPLTASFNVHLTPEAGGDFYIAPTIGYAWLDFDREPLGIDIGLDDRSENGFAWGATAGIDVPMGEGKWFFTASGRYLSVDLESGSFNNVVVHVGFGFQF